MSDASATAVEPVRYAGTYLSDADYPRRLTHATLTANLFTRGRLVRRLIIVGLALFVGVIAFTSSPNGWEGLLFFGCVIVLLAIPLIIVYPITTRLVRKHVPVGTRVAVELRDTTITIVNPDVTSTVAYSYYQSVERRSSFVLLRQRVTRRYSPLAAELFTDESYNFLVARIQPSKATAEAATPAE